jgi:hypothetical protein
MAILKLERLRCDDPDDSVTDEVMIQANGRQVWPRSGSFSISKHTEVPLNVDIPFEGEVRIALFDEEDIGADDRLGSVLIRDNEPSGERRRRVLSQSSRYVLTYRIGRVEF